MSVKKLGVERGGFYRTTKKNQQKYIKHMFSLEKCFKEANSNVMAEKKGSTLNPNIFSSLIRINLVSVLFFF